MRYFREIFLTGMFFGGALMATPQPNPPTWPASVTVFSPTDSAAFINNIVNAAYANNGGTTPVQDNGEFSQFRYAFLFKPNTLANPTYAGVSVPVGFYTSVMGLGRAPSDTQIPDVFCPGGGVVYTLGALDTFWRSAENFATTPTRFPGPQGSVMQWAVSQACPLRRIQIPASNLPGPTAGIQLWSFMPNQPQPGFASGGFMGDCNINATVDQGPQQQWFSRNCRMNWAGAVWNRVFVGCIGTIPSTNAVSGYLPGGTAATTSIDQTPVIAEKPYISFDTASSKYFLQIPKIAFNKSGPTTIFDDTTSQAVDFVNVYVVQDPANETAANINAQIGDNKHIILTPGIYENLGGPIIVNKPITILGIGFPTLIAKNGQMCIQVVDGFGGGARIGGILLQAGSSPSNPSSVLLQWGQNHSVGDNAGFLYDCFARVGGPADPSTNEVSATTMVEINNDSVIIDNAWFWRADHWSTVNGVDNPVKNGQNPCDTGLRVNGDNVIAYGLAVEHTLKDLVQWYGTNGSTYFYQAEYPYDVTQANYGSKGYTAYRVTSPTRDPDFSHNGFGLGVYSYFRDASSPPLVFVPNGIATYVPVPAGVHFTNVLTRFLNGYGGITNVINTTGLFVTGNSVPELTVFYADDDTAGPSCVPVYPLSSTFYPRSIRRAP